jgi:DNA primase
MKCAQFERTDMGNAERWLARFGQDYLYTTAKGWLGWDGRRYRVLNQEKDSTPSEVMASVFRRCAPSRTKRISCATRAGPTGKS